VKRSRGNAVPETALTVSFSLLVLYGTVQLATTAFYQISADGASFVGAHDTVAALGSPTAANRSSAVTAAGSSFARIVGSSISVLNPSGSTFETDVSQQVPGISAIGNPAALTVTSRLVEESAGTSSATPAPLLNCTQAALNIVNGANNSVLSSAPVGLLQSGSLLSQSSNVLSLNTGALTTRANLLTGVGTDLTSTVTSLGALPGSLSALTSTPVLGPILATILTPVQNLLSTGLEAPLKAALGGTFNATSSLSTIDAQLTTLITSLVGPLLGSLVQPLVSLINGVLTGGGTGLLGANGPLAALNADFTSLNTIDAGAAKC
jgi:hypothetical protein